MAVCKSYLRDMDELSYHVDYPFSSITFAKVSLCSSVAVWYLSSCSPTKWSNEVVPLLWTICRISSYHIHTEQSWYTGQLNHFVFFVHSRCWFSINQNWDVSCWNTLYMSLLKFWEVFHKWYKTDLLKWKDCLLMQHIKTRLFLTFILAMYLFHYWSVHGSESSDYSWSQMASDLCLLSSSPCSVLTRFLPSHP